MTTTTIGKNAKGISKIAAGTALILAVAVASLGVFYATASGSSSSSCASSSASISSVAPAPSSTIHVSEYSGSANSANPPGYKPDSIVLVIGVNDTVTWTNDDPAAHTVSSTNAPSSCASFNSGNMNSGASYTHTFTVPGTYSYDCRYHSWMTGTIVVKAGS
jgi:plastocyanin